MPVSATSPTGSVTAVRTALGAEVRARVEVDSGARARVAPPGPLRVDVVPEEVDPTPSRRLGAALTDVADAERSNRHTVTNAEELLARRSAGVSTRVIHENGDKATYEVTGVPAHVERFEHRAVVFRHYFANEDEMSAALAQGRLIAGPVSYAQISGRMRTYYRDLTGVFVTLPEYAPEAVGVAGRTCWVDLVFPDDTGVVQIEPGIFLVPGTPKVPDWLAALVRDYQAGREVPGYAREAVERIASTGLRDPVAVSFRVARR